MSGTQLDKRWQQKAMLRSLKERRRQKLLRKQRNRRKHELIASSTSSPEGRLSSEKSVLTCPACLDFEDHAQETIRFINFLRESITVGKYREIVIDHRPLNAISPPAILAILAHTHNAMARRSRTKLSAHLPTNSDVLALLHASGYLKYYSIPVDTRSAEEATGVLGHIRDTGVNTQNLKEFIKRWPTTGVVNTSALYEALVEAAQNADEWGYHRQATYRVWWLLAFRRPGSQEIAFCFLDMGEGIPTTIRTRWQDQLFLIKPSGSELICKAVMHGHYSRTKKNTRGNGLPTLKRLVDHANEGELLVISDHSVFRYRKNCVPTTLELGKGTRLQGTLIAWSIRKQ